MIKTSENIGTRRKISTNRRSDPMIMVDEYILMAFKESANEEAPVITKACSTRVLGSWYLAGFDQSGKTATSSDKTLVEW